MEADIDLIVRDLTDLPSRGAANQRDRLLGQLSDLRTTADRAIDGVLDQSMVDVQASLAPLQEDMVPVKTEVADLGS